MQLQSFDMFKVQEIPFLTSKGIDLQIILVSIDIGGEDFCGNFQNSCTHFRFLFMLIAIFMHI